ncbi:hypothetical protein DL765_008287 [Monosporascus sp. GIB2]|nr:hypothetical protein DL765_008287 [Monosporascus sp. GIB2]
MVGLKLSHTELLSIAEAVSDGPSVQALAKSLVAPKVVVLAGLSERDEYGIFNTERAHNRTPRGGNRLHAASLRAEFDGLKGWAWLKKWLSARAYDNGVYVVFSNPIGMDHGQLKNGCAMEKLTAAGGFRYRETRKPQPYWNAIAKQHDSELAVA